MHKLWFFVIFFQKSLFTVNYFLIALINLATRGPLYTCLVSELKDKNVPLSLDCVILVLLHK